MPIGAANYRQVATYWGAPVQSNFGGVSFAVPILVKCRWEDRNELFIDNAGNEARSNAIVWTFNRLEVGGYLFKGDSSAVSDPTTLDAALEIRRSDEIPDLRGLNMERRSYL